MNGTQGLDLVSAIKKLCIESPYFPSGLHSRKVENVLKHNKLWVENIVMSERSRKLISSVETVQVIK